MHHIDNTSRSFISQIITTVLIFIMLLLFMTSCDRYATYPTPREALKGIPGKLAGLTSEELASVQFLQEKQIPQGVVILYAWKKPLNGNHDYLATTFVAPENGGWRAQSSGFLEETNLITTSIETGNAPFTAAYNVGGNITPLATAYGISGEGKSVRILWADGITTQAPILNHAFLDVRTDSVHVQRIDLLDNDGNIIKQVSYNAVHS